jgi:hypothetical protein
VVIERGTNDARAQSFGEKQAVAGLGAAIGEYPVGIDEAGHGISELGFLVANAVSAHHRALRFHHLRKTASQDLLQYFEIALSRKTYVGQRGDGTASHGVNVAQRIGGRDLTEGVGIVDHGGEEVDGLYQREIGGDSVDAGIIGMIETDQNVWIVLTWQLAQYFVEHSGAQLGSAASGFHGFRKADCLYIGHEDLLKEIVEFTDLRIGELQTKGFPDFNSKIRKFNNS